MKVLQPRNIATFEEPRLIQPTPEHPMANRCNQQKPKNQTNQPTHYNPTNNAPQTATQGLSPVDQSPTTTISTSQRTKPTSPLTTNQPTNSRKPQRRVCPSRTSRQPLQSAKATETNHSAQSLQTNQQRPANRNAGSVPRGPASNHCYQQESQKQANQPNHYNPTNNAP